jgi:hypothetical protein
LLIKYQNCWLNTLTQWNIMWKILTTRQNNPKVIALQTDPPTFLIFHLSFLPTASNTHDYYIVLYMFKHMLDSFYLTWLIYNLPLSFCTKMFNLSFKTSITLLKFEHYCKQSKSKGKMWPEVNEYYQQQGNILFHKIQSR